MVFLPNRLLNHINLYKDNYGNAFHQKCVKICSVLFNYASFNNDNDTEQYYRITDKKLRQLVGGYQLNQVKKAMEQSGLLQVDHSYSSGNFGKGYRLNSQFFDGELQIAPVKRAEAPGILASSEADDSDFQDQEWLRLSQWLLGNFRSLCFRSELRPQIDQNGILRIAEPKLMDQWDWCANQELVHGQEVSNFHAKQMCLSNIYKIHEFSSNPGSNSVELIRSRRVGRVFSPLTSLKREARQYLQTTNGESLCEIDCNACHAFLLLKLYEVNDVASYQQVEDERQSYYKLWSMDPVTGVQDFYTALMGLCGVKAKRSELKVSFLADFLNVRKPRRLGIHIDRVYSLCFSLLYEVMNRIKTNRFFAQNDPYWASFTKAKPTYV